MLSEKLEKLYKELDEIRARWKSEAPPKKKGPSEPQEQQIDRPRDGERLGKRDALTNGSTLAGIDRPDGGKSHV